MRLNTKKQGYRLLFGLLLAVSIALLAGCDTEPTEVADYQPQPVLSAFLNTGEPMDSLRLEWVGEFTAYYTPEAYGIVGADIRIFPVLDDQGDAVADTSGLAVYFEDDPDTAGVYRAVNPDGREPLASWRYRIEVKKPSDGVDVWAETTMPGPFQLFTAPPGLLTDTLAFTRDDPTITVMWSLPATFGGYVFNIVTLVPREQLVPLDPDWDPNDPNDELEESEKGRLAWTFGRDDQRLMNIPWLFFRWQGLHRLDVLAASTEYFDYAVSILNRVGDISSYQIKSNVHGGIGIFGGVYRKSIYLVMERTGG